MKRTGKRRSATKASAPRNLTQVQLVKAIEQVTDSAQLESLIKEAQKRQAVTKEAEALHALTAAREIQGRWPNGAIVENIKTALKTSGRTIEELSAHLGYTKWVIYKRFSEQVSFTVREIGRAADFFGAPTFWPMISWDLALRIDRFLQSQK